MTDRELLEKRLVHVLDSVREMRGHGDPSRIATDRFQRAFYERRLQTAIQSALDAASHIVSERGLGEPRNNQELFVLLAQDGWLSDELALTCRRMVGFRNVLVHQYMDVDLDRLRDIAENRLADLEEFVRSIRDRIGRQEQ
jgi:uncharacterized protein YutE (UPF0331/DUF86 family)